MNSLLKKIRESSFAVDSLKLFTGSTISQFISLISFPLITRLYLPSVYANLAVFISLCSLISVIYTLRLEWAIIVADSKQEINNLLTIIGTSVAVFTLSIYILLYLLDIKNFFLYPIGFLAYSINSVGHKLNSKIKDYTRMSISRIAQQLIFVLFIIIGGYIFGYNELVLISGYVLSYTLSSMYLLYKYIIDNYLSFNFNVLESRRLIIKHKEFPLFSVPSSFVATSIFEMPVIILGYYFNSSVVAFYSLAYKVLNKPLTLFIDSLSQVYHERIVNERDKRKVTISLYKYGAVIGLIPVVIMLLFGVELFELVFGSNWSDAGNFGLAILPAIYLGIIFEPTKMLLQVIKKQKIELIVYLFTIILSFIALYTGYIYKNAILAVLLYSIVIAMMRLSRIIFNLILIK